MMSRLKKDKEKLTTGENNFIASKCLTGQSELSVWLIDINVWFMFWFSGIISLVDETDFKDEDALLLGLILSQGNWEMKCVVSSTSKWILS